MSSNNPNRVYLDTETTGLHPEEGDEILSLTIVDANGRLLFDERFKPKHKKEWPEAQAVNHISPDDVEHLTTIDAYMEQICRILDRIADEIVGYNIAFDIGSRRPPVPPSTPMPQSSTPCKNSWIPSETQIRDIDTNRSPWQLNVSATTGRAPRMARFPTPSPALPHRNASTTITGVWRTLSLPKTLSCTPNRLRTVQRGFQKTAGTSTPEAARLPSRSRFSIGSRALRNSAHEPVPPPVHAHDRQPVVRQSGTVTAKPARPVCRYRTRGKCLEQPA